MLSRIITVARCLVALKWKCTTSQCLPELHMRIRDVKWMEYLTASLNDSLEQYNKAWKL